MINMRNDILKKVDILYIMWKQGSLGGEFMPEDENPNLEKNSLENYLYFTLPMALNYQRNSYTLWESANKTYLDLETRFVYNPKEVLKRTFEEVQYALTKYKVALQKNKQTEIWIKLCKTFVELYDGDIRKMFDGLDNDVNKIRDFIQKQNKTLFPYLSGNKLCNYWLFVVWQYTDREYINIENLTVAPDTHVIKSTHKLGLIDDNELNSSDVQLIVINRWNELLKGTKYKPIDIHTALWLWSRNGFPELMYYLLNSTNIKDKIKNTMRFYLLATKLKYKIRTAWDKNHWNISKDRIESVAEHVYGTCILAISLDSEFDFEIDLNKVLKMLVIHEIGEVIIGDITPFEGISIEEKEKIKHEAVISIVGDLIKKEELISLILEFDEHKTKESIFAYYCDKLEADIQAKVYQDTECFNSLDNMQNNIVFKSDKVQKMLEEGAQTAFDIWYEWDKDKFSNNEIFIELLDYIRNNNTNI